MVCCSCWIGLASSDKTPGNFPYSQQIRQLFVILQWNITYRIGTYYRQRTAKDSRAWMLLCPAGGRGRWPTLCFEVRYGRDFKKL
jgi:hypothetical protein